MMYLLALVVPPLALLLSGRPFQAVFNGILWVLGLALLLLPFVPGLPLLGIVVLWALVADALRRDRAQQIG
jgi:uncharacterized membrane protein